MSWTWVGVEWSCGVKRGGLTWSALLGSGVLSMVELLLELREDYHPIDTVARHQNERVVIGGIHTY